MNRPLLLILFCCLLSSFSFAQKIQKAHDHNHNHDDPKYFKKCGFDEYNEELARLDPEFRKALDYYRDVVLPEITQQARTRSAAPKTTIFVPIVVHVIHTAGEDVGEGSNLSMERIQEQIDIMNEDFRAENPEFSQTPARWSSIIDTPSIQFCFAVVDPDGNPTTGVTRDAYVVTGSNRQNSNINQIKRETVWDSRYYYNIWTLPIPGTTAGGGVTGFATLPFAGTPGSPTDGSVCDWRWFGGPNTGGSGWRTMTHESGHYLGLYHTFHDDTNCSVDDGLADTPLQARNTNDVRRLNCNNGYPTGPSTCNGEEHLYVNYMDYTTCETSFTRDQVEVMRAVLEGRSNVLGWASRKELADNSMTVCTFFFNDASIADVRTPGISTCELDDVTPEVTIQNLGIDTLLTAKIFYQVDNDPPVEFVWVDFLIPGARSKVNLPAFTPPSPSYTFTVWTEEPNGEMDERTENDTASVVSTIRYPESGQLPLEEDFEQDMFPTSTGLYTPDTGFPEWEIRTGLNNAGQVTKNLHIDNTRQTAEGIDRVITRLYDFSDITFANLSFDMAYTYYQNGGTIRYDSLLVLVSTDCGNNFDQRVWADGGETMATAPPTQSFYSPSPGEWRTIDIDLSQFDNVDNLTLAFVSMSGNGNAIHLDNINLSYLIFNEAGVVDITSPTDFECATSFEPEVTIKNGGALNLTELEIYYQVNNDPPARFDWTGNLAPDATELVTLPTITSGSTFDLTVYVKNPNGEVDPYLVNDTARINTVIPNFYSLTYTEDFQTDLNLPSANDMEAVDYSPGMVTAQWEVRANVVGIDGNPGNAVRLNNRFTAGNEGTRDGLFTPYLDFSSVQNASLTFDLAYKYYSRNGVIRYDSLQILVSTDCGQTYPHEIFYDGGETLATDPVPAGSFIPRQNSWENIQLDLSAFNNEDNVRIQFVNISGYGLPIYLDNINIDLPCNITVDTDKTDVQCFSECTGEGIISNPSGGVAPYTYQWDANAGDQTTATATGLCANQTYAYTVTDAEGCVRIGSVAIVEPEEIDLSAISIDPLCNGERTGSASATALGGLGDFSYTWSTVPVQNGPIATGLGAGTYTVTVADAASCTKTATVTLAEPEELSATASKTDIICNGANDGTATATPLGGTGDWTYSWSTVPVQTTQTATGLAPGTYTCSVTDVNDCLVTVEVTIEEPDAMVLGVIDVEDVTCDGDNNGSATLDPTGGSTPYTYLWNDIGSQTTRTATGLVGGTYTPTVTDNNGCTQTIDVIIDSPEELDAVVNVVEPDCGGIPTGSITLDPSGGTTDYTYAWSDEPTRTSNQATGLSGGTYTFTITDANGCSVVDTRVISEPIPITGDASITDVRCNGESNGSIIITADGGTGNLVYSWSDDPGRNGPIASPLSAGTYTVTVVDENDCEFIIEETVSEPDALSVSVSTTGESGLGLNDGSATANPTGGTGPYTYAWSNSGNTMTISPLAPDTYTVTITDANGCTTTGTGTVNSFNCGNLELEISKTDVACNGESSGSATAILTGGTDPLTYAWSLPASTASINNLAAGTYTVTATDADGCFKTAEVTIEEPAALTLVMGSTNETFLGDNDGTASATVGGGTQPYTYQWSNDSTNATMTNLAPGTYTVIVTDANGCTISDETEVEPGVDCSQLEADFTTTNVGCNGDQTGAIDAIASGGTDPYTWSWNIPQTGPNLTSLSAGVYTTTLMDANGCSIIRTVTITEPDPLTVTTSFTNETILGASDGTATANPMGGTPDYTYLWSNTETSQTITGLAPGIYTVTVTDENGCSTEDEVTISTGVDCSQFEVLVNKSDVSCPGDEDGSITLDISGGEAPFTYQWSTSAGNTNMIDGLAPGTYSATVTDANDCTQELEITIEEPDELSFDQVITADLTCFEANDGFISVVVTGGTGDYTYSWSHDFALDDNIADNLAAGDYTVTVIDEKGCNANTTITLEQPDELTVFVNTISETMAGMNDGSATATVGGGTDPYTYSWQPGGSDSNPLTGLGAGTYTVLVTDRNGCTATAEGTVLEGVDCSDLELQIQTFDITCNGDDDGEIIVTPEGGMDPYTYSWNVPGNTGFQNNLEPGTYTVVVSDANGCSRTENVNIIEPDALEVDFEIIDLECAGDQNGSILLSPSGGTGAYTYTWSIPGNGPIQGGLSGGIYEVTITDANRCETQLELTVEEPDELIVTVNTIDETQFGLNDGSAEASVSGGTGAYTYAWSTISSDNPITGLGGGIYTVTVTDENGCTAIGEGEVLPGFNCADLGLNVASQNISCNGERDGLIEITPENGEQPYTYSWNVPGNTNTQSGLSAGTYTVEVSDANGCLAETEITIIEPDALEVNTQQNDIDCAGDADGVAFVSPSGGTPGYTFAWSNNGTGPVQSGLSGGPITVTVTDARGCTLVENFLIDEPDEIELTVSGTDETAFRAEDGTASASATGGVDPYVFTWNTTPPQSGADIDFLKPGTYIVTVTDYNGCEQIDSVTINAVPPDCSSFNVAVVKEDVTCFGEANGSISLTASGGFDPYTFTWADNSTDPNRTGLPAGEYTYTLTDDAGCETIETINISQPAELTLFTNSRNPDCGNTSNVTGNPNGGTAPYTYAWSSGDDTQSVDGLAEGNYGLTVTDANGCTATSSAQVEPGAEGITLSSASQPPTCHGDSDGFITVDPITGTAPFTYRWNTGETTADLMDVPEGRYTLRITDANNCSFIRSFNLVAPAELDVDFTVLQPTDDISPDGVVVAQAYGGTTPYTYTWLFNNSNDNTLDGVGVGTYYIQIVDARGCSMLDSVVVDLTTTSIDNLESLDLLQMYPNPTLQDLFLNAEFNRVLDVRFDLIDLTGRLIWTQEARDSRFQFRINLQNYPSGTYLLRLTTDEGYVVRKVIRG